MKSMMSDSFADKQNQKAMADILDRVRNLDMAEQPIQPDASTPEADPGAELAKVSQDTLARILNSDRDGDLDISTIPAEDRRVLEAALAATEPSDLLQPWEAWWNKPESFSIRLCEDGTGLVEELQVPDEDPDSPRAGESCPMSTPPPPPTDPIVPLESLTSSSPSPVLYHVQLQLLYAYCCALRLYNGDARTDIESYIAVLWQLFPGLSNHTDGGALPTTLDEAVHDSMVHLRELHMGVTLDIASVSGLSTAVWSDVATLCSAGCGAVVCALADVHRQHKMCEQQLKLGKHQRGTRMHTTSKLGLKKLKLAIRKVEFYTSFAHTQTDTQYSQLSQALKVSTTALQQHSSEHEREEERWERMLLVDPKRLRNES